MSAIFGTYHYTESSAPPREILYQLASGLKHYPCDNLGFWDEENIGLGCHAQWITVESIGATLPLFDGILGLAITADAIIDNREQLFELLGIGLSFRDSMTDAQLLIAAYHKWYKDTPKYVIGDYAFVIWDKSRNELFGARDLLGSRSLYFSHQAGKFAFCSVLNPLLGLPYVNKRLNEEWLSEFITIPFVLDAVDVHGTLYQQIQQLPPAHRFILRDGKLTVEQYDSLITPIRPLALRSNEEYEEAFSEVFQQAVTSKLRTSRKVGASLSGGLDSAAVVSFASNPLSMMGKTLHTYSYIPSADFMDWTPKRWVANERPYVESIVKQVGNMEEHYLDFPDRSSFDDIDEMIQLMEGPYKFLENSFWLKGMLEEAGKGDIGVLLNGSRGNYSISFGPAEDYYALLLKRLKWLTLYREVNQFGANMQLGRKRLFKIIFKQAFPSLVKRVSVNKSEGQRPMLIQPEFARSTRVLERLATHDVGLRDVSMNEFETRLSEFGEFFVSNHIGTSLTRFSLKYGLVERDPTSDPRVIRFCLSLPVNQFVQGGVDRSIIRRVTRERLPDDVRLNQMKRGVQGADWIHRMKKVWPDFLNEVESISRDSNLSYYLNLEQIKLSLAEIGRVHNPALAFNPHARLLMQSLIIARFLNRM